MFPTKRLIPKRLTVGHWPHTLGMAPSQDASGKMTIYRDSHAMPPPAFTVKRMLGSGDKTTIECIVPPSRMQRTWTSALRPANFLDANVIIMFFQCHASFLRLSKFSCILLDDSHITQYLPSSILSPRVSTVCPLPRAGVLIMSAWNLRRIVTRQWIHVIYAAVGLCHMPRLHLLFQAGIKCSLEKKFFRKQKTLNFGLYLVWGVLQEVWESPPMLLSRLIKPPCPATLHTVGLTVLTPD